MTITNFKLEPFEVLTLKNIFSQKGVIIKMTEFCTIPWRWLPVLIHSSGVHHCSSKLLHPFHIWLPLLLPVKNNAECFKQNLINSSNSQMSGWMMYPEKAKWLTTLNMFNDGKLGSGLQGNTRTDKFFVKSLNRRIPAKSWHGYTQLRWLRVNPFSFHTMPATSKTRFENFWKYFWWIGADFDRGKRYNPSDTRVYRDSFLTRTQFWYKWQLSESQPSSIKWQWIDLLI